MNKQENQENQEFTLEDILKEFGSHPDEPAITEEPVPVVMVAAEEEEVSAQPEAVIEPEPEAEELPEPEAPVVPETEETPEVQPEEPVVLMQEEPQAEESEVLSGDTIRLPEIPQPFTDTAVSMGDTIRMDAVVLPKGKVTIAKPVEEEPEEKPEEEAFTQQWEPEYEQPMGEYVPQQPILFRPRSQLRELKRKLVAGPEKKYYELMEQGVGKLQAAIFLSFLVVVLSGISTAMYAMGAVEPNRMRLLVFCQLMAMLVSALFGCFQLMEGIADLFHKRFTLNTLLVITFAFCCVDAVNCLQVLRVPCCAAFSLEMTMSLWNAYHVRSTQMGQTDTMRKATRLDALCAQPGYYGKAKGFLRKNGQVEDFMNTYAKRSGPQKVFDWYAFFALLASLGVAVVAYLYHDLATAVQVAAVCLLAAVPATAFITLSRPMAILEKRLHKLGVVICGWRGVKGLAGKAVFPIHYEDLFPADTVKMNGVKFFGSREPDEVVAYSAALVNAGGSGLDPLFQQVLDSRNGRHYDVEEFRAYLGGIGGIVDGEPVLAGTATFLREMGVEVPDSVRVSNAVYVSVDGELSGLFAMTYEKSKSTVAGLFTLGAHARIKPILVSGDFTLTENALRVRLGLKMKKIILPELSQRLELAAVEADPEAPALLLKTREGLAPLAYGVTGARTLRVTSILGLIMHILGGLLGIGVMLTLVLVGGLHLLTPANLFLFQLIWMIPGLLITEWARAV